MNQEQERKLNELYDFMQKMKNSTTIPFDVAEAIKARNPRTSLIVSSKGVDTEDVTVNEAGTGSYQVMNDPDGFLEIEISGTTYYIPYFG